MNAVLRHLAARLWLTAAIGGMLSLGLLPLLQAATGPSWVSLWAVVVLAGCFFSAGWMMNAAGLRLLKRHLKEAGVWEQAGMAAEAKDALDRGVGLFDSFWLSPFRRKTEIRWFAGRLARFHMAQLPGNAHARQWLCTYLHRFPEDETIAALWLEQLSLFSAHTANEQVAADRIGQYHPRKSKIQLPLMAFYLSSGRVDFDALQVYRRVYLNQKTLPKEQIQATSRLLTKAAVVSPWALQLHIQAYHAGERSALAAIAAGLRWLPRNPEYQEDVEAAESIVAKSDPPLAESSVLRFKPAEMQVTPRERSRSTSQQALALVASAKSMISRCIAAVHGLPGILGRGVKRPILWIFLVVPVAVMLTWFAGTSLLIRTPEAPPAPEPVAQAPEHNDPFTIQVAAYLKPADAQRFVDQLMQKGLDAYWTEASSANRTWYQVKVSHFASKEAAREYGRQLKSKGLIDDFYVANFDGVAKPSPKTSVP